jgi:carbamoyl-phosphate synthase large subunit
MKNGDIHLVFNTTAGTQAIEDSFSIRETALLERIPYYTTTAGSIAAAAAIKTLCTGSLDVASLQSYSGSPQ